MKTSVLVAFLCATTITYAQVGIGTNSPSANSVLDLSSTDKGLLLPRLNDTTNVSSPSAGLMIYNSNAGKPAFHDGSRWNTLADDNPAATATSDSITYTIINGSSGFVNGTYKLNSISFGGTNNTTGPVSYQDINIVKPSDVNSMAFIKAMTFYNAIAPMVIEIKVYVPGASTPYYSVKLTTCNFNAISGGVSNAAGSAVSELISISPRIIGFKDWVSNTSFAFNRQTNTEVAY